MNERLPVALARQIGGRGSITIRLGRHADAGPRRLALLADRRLPEGPVLVAEADSVALAARSLVDGVTVTDPFAATADVVQLLELRAAQLDAAAA
ncbi:MAG TPA: hypothetical protein VH572_08455 [Gaiella sp.]|jgi:hypothetical protein